MRVSCSIAAILLLLAEVCNANKNVYSNYEVCEKRCVYKKDRTGAVSSNHHHSIRNSASLSSFLNNNFLRYANTK